MGKNDPTPNESGSEEWRPIPTLEYYEASTLGRVRSLDRTLHLIGRWGPMTRFHAGKVLRLKMKANGSGAFYHCFYAGEGRWMQANRAICMAFKGPPPSDRHEAAHLDGDSLNDKPDNLDWVTPKENASHKTIHGTQMIGSKNAASRLREDNIPDIFRRYCSGDLDSNIAADYGVSAAHIKSILNRKIWKHVAVDPDLYKRATEILKENLERSWQSAAQRMRERGHSLKPISP